MILRKMSFQTIVLRNDLILVTVSIPPCSAIRLSVSAALKSVPIVITIIKATNTIETTAVNFITRCFPASLKPSSAIKVMKRCNPNKPIIGTTTCAITNAIIGVLNLL